MWNHSGTVSKNAGRLALLDVLRAVAVLMVIGSHLHEAPRELPRVIVQAGDWLRQYGWLGVDLFFVLSGFLVSGLLFREYKERGSVAIGRFLMRRGLKIYPAFYVFLIVSVLLRLRLGDVIGVPAVVCESLFVQNYTQIIGWNVWSHTWSLAVEEHFYLLLAGLFLVLVRSKAGGGLKRLPLIFALVAVSVAVFRAWTFASFPYSSSTHRFPTHLQIDSLLFGVLVAYYYHMQPAFRGLMERLAWPILAASVAIVFLSQALPNGAGRYLAGHVLTYVGFGGIVVSAVSLKAPEKGWVRGIILVIAAVGSYSYSIYLWHTFVPVLSRLAVAKLLHLEMGYYLDCTVAVLASVGVGIVMAICVEIPVLKLRDRLLPSLRPESRATSDVAGGIVTASV